jgi:hypothetical protein
MSVLLKWAELQAYVEDLGQANAAAITIKKKWAPEDSHGLDQLLQLGAMYSALKVHMDDLAVDTMLKNINGTTAIPQ